MAAVHLTNFFRAPGDESVIRAQCSDLLDALMARETSDPRVTDSTVSADLDLGLVQIEAYAEADDRAQAEALILERIESVVDDTVGLKNAADMRHESQLIVS